MTLNWVAPSTGGAVETYILYDTIHGTEKDLQSTSLSYTLPDLTAETEYNVFLKAKNAIGMSDGSSAIKVRTDKAGGETTGAQVTKPTFSVSSNRAQEILVTVTPLSGEGKFKLQYLNDKTYG